MHSISKIFINILYAIIYQSVFDTVIIMCYILLNQKIGGCFMDKKELAVRYKHNGCNCCQAVLAAYAEELGISLEYAKKLGSAFGAGMGGMQGNCGALIGAEMVLGLKEYNGRSVTGKSRTLFTEFAEKCKGTICIDLKGVLTGKMLCSCDNCVRNAVEALENVL